LDKVLQLSGVSYNWRTDEFPANNFDSKTHLGFIAQDVEKIVPDLVTTGADGFKGIDYSGFSSLLVNAVKEQQTQVTSLAANLDSLNLKTDASVTTLSGLQTSVDANLLTISGTLATLDTRLSSIDDTKTGKLTTLDNRILSLEKTVGLSASALSHETRIADLESQMTTLKDENLALMDFFTTFKSGGIVTKDKEGNVDLLGGRLTAKIIETGRLVIDSIDPDAPTVGTATITPSSSGSDGKSVFVKTAAVTDTVKIFTNYQNDPGSSSWVEKKKANGAYSGFIIHLATSVSSDVKADWLIIEQNGGDSSSPTPPPSDPSTPDPGSVAGASTETPPATPPAPTITLDSALSAIDDTWANDYLMVLDESTYAPGTDGSLPKYSVTYAVDQSGTVPTAKLTVVYDHNTTGTDKTTTLRVLVPTGSWMTDTPPDVGSSHGKKYFRIPVLIPAGAGQKVVLEYALKGLSPDIPYDLKIQKQTGSGTIPVSLSITAKDSTVTTKNVTLDAGDFVLSTSKEH
jgi:hypothetical protein